MECMQLIVVRETKTCDKRIHYKSYGRWTENKNNKMEFMQLYLDTSPVVQHYIVSHDWHCIINFIPIL